MAKNFLINQINEVLTKIGQMVTGQTETSQSIVDNNTTKINELINSLSTEIGDLITNQNSNFTSMINNNTLKINELIAELNTEIGDLISSQDTNFTSLITDQATRFNNMITELQASGGKQDTQITKLTELVTKTTDLITKSNTQVTSLSNLVTKSDTQITNLSNLVTKSDTQITKLNELITKQEQSIPKFAQESDTIQHTIIEENRNLYTNPIYYIPFFSGKVRFKVTAKNTNTTTDDTLIIYKNGVEIYGEDWPDSTTQTMIYDVLVNEGDEIKIKNAGTGRIVLYSTAYVCYTLVNKPNAVIE